MYTVISAARIRMRLVRERVLERRRGALERRLDAGRQSDLSFGIAECAHGIAERCARARG